MSLPTQRAKLLLNVTSIQHDGFIQYLLSSKCYDSETGFFSVTCDIIQHPSHWYEGIETSLQWLIPKGLKKYGVALLADKESRHIRAQDVLFCSPELKLGDNTVAILQSIPNALDESLLFEYLGVNTTSPHHQTLFWQSALGTLSDGSLGKSVVDLFGLPHNKQSKITSRFNGQSWLKSSIETLCERKESQLCYAVSRNQNDRTQYLSFDTDDTNKLVNLQWKECVSKAFLFAKIPHSQVQEITSAYKDEHQINKVLREYCHFQQQLEALEDMLPFLRTMDNSVKLDWVTLNET
ncbi:hypothetical protein ACGRL8_16555 [Vibrio rumoiensis]|uniref:DUF4123 domain-containing protein n=1 Tax=Vibrio rumoiensis TaxID=76258 RepID=A0ABW7IXN4_9VIBR|nr:hypothetical protein [Vibrio rumoiensis]